MPKNLNAFFQIFRLKDWYSSKATGLAGLLFLYALQFNLTFEAFTKILAPAFCTLIGLAALGYLINDLSDRSNDAQAGKSNFFHKSSFLKGLLAFLAAILFAFLPWYFLPFDWVVGCFLGGEILLFCLYSFKPVRLKTKPILGLFADALYAHVLPSLFAGYTFWLVGDIPFPKLFLLSLGIWQFFVGLRNIMQHHVLDRKADKKSNTYNVYIKNPLATLQWISKKVLPLEIIFFLLFLLSINQNRWVFISLFLVFAIGSIFTWRNALVWKIRTKLNAGLYSPAFFYEHRLGLIAGFILAIQNTWYLIPLLVYVLVFQVDFKSIIANSKVLVYKILVIPLYRTVIQPWYKYVVTPFHHVFLKNAYHCGHKLKIWLGLKPKDN